MHDKAETAKVLNFVIYLLKSAERNDACKLIPVYFLVSTREVSDTAQKGFPRARKVRPFPKCSPKVIAKSAKSVAGGHAASPGIGSPAPVCLGLRACLIFVHTQWSFRQVASFSARGSE
jgi:hypothetical protein